MAKQQSNAAARVRKKVRKNIARVKTVLRAQEIAAEKETA